MLFAPGYIPTIKQMSEYIAQTQSNTNTTHKHTIVDQAHGQRQPLTLNKNAITYNAAAEAHQV